jgi:hypothetical protein
MPRILR